MTETKDKIKKFDEYSSAEQDEMIFSLKKYLVRKQISDSNKELREHFAKIGNDSYAENISYCFSAFNSYFVNEDLYNFKRNYEDIKEYEYFAMSEKDQQISDFNYQMSMICLSRQAGASIPNHVTLPVMVAYANMQDEVLDMLKQKKYKLSSILDVAATNAREDYFNKYGESINESQVLPTEEAHKFNTKTNLKKWLSFLNFLKDMTKESEPYIVKKYLENELFLTNKKKDNFGFKLKQANEEATKFINDKKDYARKTCLTGNEESIDLQFNEYANPADYDEIYSPEYEYEIKEDFEKTVIEEEINNLINKFKTQLNNTKKPSQPGEE